MTTKVKIDPKKIKLIRKLENGDREISINGNTYTVDAYAKWIAVDGNGFVWSFANKPHVDVLTSYGTHDKYLSWLGGNAILFKQKIVKGENIEVVNAEDLVWQISKIR